MTIIRKAPHPGWSKTTELPRSAVTCHACGAICDESLASEHDEWHAVLDLKTLPMISDFVTWSSEPHAEAPDPADVETSSIKAHVRLPSLVGAAEPTE